jgi:hypothetical protein
MTENETAIMNYLLENTDPDSYLVATTNAKVAAPYILETGRAVLTFGGFSGSDQVVDANAVAEMVANGELRYILYNDTINQSHRDIANWVTESCITGERAGCIQSTGECITKSESTANRGSVHNPIIRCSMTADIKQTKNFGSLKDFRSFQTLIQIGKFMTVGVLNTAIDAGAYFISDALAGIGCVARAGKSARLHGRDGEQLFLEPRVDLWRPWQYLARGRALSR